MLRPNMSMNVHAKLLWHPRGKGPTLIGDRPKGPPHAREPVENTGVEPVAFPTNGRDALAPCCHFPFSIPK